jgi:phospholipase A1/A2
MALRLHPDRLFTIGLLALAAALAAGPAGADEAVDGWQACRALSDGSARLACFDGWAQQQPLQQQQQPAPQTPPPVSPLPETGPIARAPSPQRALIGVRDNACQSDAFSPLSRFWELQSETDCGTFELRGYRPMSLDVVASSSVNQQPTSPAPGRNALTPEDFQRTEARIQISARVKVLKDILTGGDPSRSDSLWLAYTQQSYWQIFSGGISRPFRTTDYQPEAIYAYPFDVGLVGGLRLRYGGLGLSHQSNGRELPLSRSWNRAYLMAGLDLGRRFSLEGKIWKRLDANADDDNPGITDFIGRGELTATWRADAKNTYSGTVRSSLASHSNGSVRLEYFRALGKGNRAGGLNDLRLHLQAFSGYGDSLLDYNRRRSVFSVGLALVDW